MKGQPPLAQPVIFIRFDAKSLNDGKNSYIPRLVSKGITSTANIMMA